MEILQKVVDCFAQHSAYIPTPALPLEVYFKHEDAYAQSPSLPQWPGHTDTQRTRRT